MRPRIYVAGPLSNGDEAMNIRAAIDVAEKIIELGGIPFVPHLTWFWHFYSPRLFTYRFWVEVFDFAWLDTCHAMYRIAGESHGSDLEEAHCKECGIPVFTDLTELAKFIERIKDIIE